MWDKLITGRLEIGAWPEVERYAVVIISNQIHILSSEIRHFTIFCSDELIPSYKKTCDVMDDIHSMGLLFVDGFEYMPIDSRLW